MATTYDALAISKLSKVSDFVMLQTLRWDDAFSCSLYPNLYSFSDKNLLQTVPGTSTQSPTPVFIMEEESDCCCRMCCPTCQPMTLKLYHADQVQNCCYFRWQNVIKVVYSTSSFNLYNVEHHHASCCRKDEACSNTRHSKYVVQHKSPFNRSEKVL